MDLIDLLLRMDKARVLAVHHADMYRKSIQETGTPSAYHQEEVEKAAGDFARYFTEAVKVAMAAPSTGLQAPTRMPPPPGAAT